MHLLVGRQTEDQARSTTLAKLDTVAASYVTKEHLGTNATINPNDLPASLRAMARQGKRGTQLADHRGRQAMWAVTPAEGKALAGQSDDTKRAAASRGLSRTIIGSSAAAIGLTPAAGLTSVSRITRRLHHTARIARRISAGDLDARVNDPRAGRPGRAQDEAAAVATALDAMAASLQGRLYSEQRFTADVSHELRTLLAGLHSAAELLPPAARPRWCAIASRLCTG